MQHYWFKPKRYGLGASPASWQGWALTAVYVAALTAAAIWFASDEPAINDRAFTFAIISTVLTIVFVGIAWRTTEGGWRWRWGDKG